MKYKSKFMTFILSFLPGLGQLYLGFTTRGIIFLISSLGIMALGLLTAFGMRSVEISLFLLFILFALWLAAMIDSMILVDKVNMGVYSNQNNNNESQQPNSEEIAMQNKKVTAMFLSIIPGVGHLYLGLQRQGIELVLTFFLLFFITDWVSFSGFLVLAPVIWFYSLFDVMHKASGDKEMKDDDIFTFDEMPFIKDKSKALGYGLVILGVILILNRILFPSIMRYLDFQTINNIKTGIVAILFILGGIKLIMGNKDILKGKEE